MPTATRLTLTPADHGREIDPDDFEHSTGNPDFHFEIIDGRVFVSPQSDLPQEFLAHWLYGKLLVALLTQKLIRIGRDTSPWGYVLAPRTSAK